MTTSFDHRSSLSDRELSLLRTVGTRGWSGLASQRGRLRPSPGRGPEFFSTGSLCLSGDSPILIGAEARLTSIRTEVFRIAIFNLPQDRRSLFRPPLKNLEQGPLAELAKVLGGHIEEILVLSVEDFPLGSKKWLLDEGVLFRRGARRLLVTTSRDLPLDIDLTTNARAIQSYLRRVVSARCVFHR